MTELTLFISGLFCFGLTVLGVVLTAIEFDRGNKPAIELVEETKHETATIHQLHREAA